MDNNKIKEYIQICTEEYKRKDIRAELRRLTGKFSEEYIMEEIKLMIIEGIHKE